MKQKEILDNMLNRVPEDYDKTDGGLFFDNLSPISFELEKAYQLLQDRFLNTFGETARGEYLDKIVEEVGLSRRQATHSKGTVEIKGTPTTLIPKGTQFASDSYYFTTTRDTTIGTGGKSTVEIESVGTGSQYNLPIGAVNKIPVTVPGVDSVTNSTPTIDGYDIETDEELRERYFIKVREPITSGNVYHYRKWALDVDGVGAVKVFPLWAGNGTVKVAIIDSKKEVAQRELIERVQNYINQERPIGATVTVVSATPKLINVTVNVKLSVNVNNSEVKEVIKNNLINHFKSTAFKINSVSYAQVGNTILHTDGVLDYDELTINNDKKNISIGDEEIAQLGTLNIEVIV